MGVAFKSSTHFIAMTFLTAILFVLHTALTPAITEAPGPKAVNREKLIQLVNLVRKTGVQCGNVYYPPVPPLVWETKLEQAALLHSMDMEQHQYFSHVAVDGSRAGERLDRIGYNWRAYGENIGKGYTTEKEIVEAWLKSPGHCKNIMSKLYKEMGVGRSGHYWTQTFGTRGTKGKEVVVIR